MSLSLHIMWVVFFTNYATVNFEEMLLHGNSYLHHIKMEVLNKLDV